MAEQRALGFGGLLRQLRVRARLTQEELAEAAGLSPRSVSDLERGINRTARKDTAELLAGALGLAGPVRPLFVAAARGRVPAEQVLAELRGEAPAPAVPAPDPAWPDGPYLGLVPFEERGARLFYGRDELADRLVGRLAERLDGAGILLEPAVVEAVVAELRDEAGGGLGSWVLPLMSQAMAATWERREGNALTLRGYRRAGGVADAVNRGAQAAYDALTGGQQDAARLVFTQLTVITASGQFVRHRCRRADLSSARTPMAADIDAVVGVFSGRRLLVLGEESVEIAHDALLQAWKQLRDWLADDQIDRALYGQVVTDAATWDSNRRDPAYLYRPGRLATIDAAAARWRDAPARYPALPATGEAFLGAAHHAARRATRRRRGAFAILALLTALAVTASVVALSQRAAAIRQRDQAIYTQVMAEALQFDASDTPLAAQLILAAYRLRPTQDLASQLLNTENIPLSSPSAAGAGSVNDLVFSPGGRTLATGSSDGTIRLWDVADPARPRPLGQPLIGSSVS